MANNLQLLIQGAPGNAALGMAAKDAARPLTDGWTLAEMDGPSLNAAEAWDRAHEATHGAAFAEPDFQQPWPSDRRSGSGLAARPGEQGSFSGPNSAFPAGPGFAWHLRPEFTQLADARAEIEKLGAKRSLVRIGILDVGFDFSHQALPKPPLLRLDLQRNFAGDDQAEDDASDPYNQGRLRQNQPGHGTGTLSILAGPLLQGMLRPDQNNVTLGGNPFAEIIPCRIGPSVVLPKTSAFVDAVKYLLAPKGDASLRADVISMSMGGLASEAWADIVNQAYEAGIVIVTAAGNNFGAPKAIVYPARFNRVIAACGVMANGEPYIAGFGTMSGNFGPASKMQTALATYTPNIPWAEVNAKNIVDMDGAGTSAATPQIAAAAALWLNKYKDGLKYDKPWQKVEAVRNALFSSARKPAAGEEKHFGRGILQASKALGIGPTAKPAFTERDSASWEFFKLLQKPLGVAAETQPPRDRMFNLELTQLLQRDAKFEQLAGDPAAGLDEKTRNTLLAAAAESPLASKALRERCKQVLGASPSAARPTEQPPQASVAARYPQSQTIPVRPPAVRCLRAYGFDPSMSTRLETARLNQVTIEIPWEKLSPGPVGEYIEVVDHDPATGCFYAPVDLDNPYLLASDGLAPSEGNPQFHQQMVYTVAMRTITNFETALGRKALWASKDEDGKGFVRRLRIYPHALRAQNAYYHPGKKALLFGYFPAESGDPQNILPGGVVFTCLSHDVVAHETTHALLDGMYRHFNHPSNADLLAFHEAFADIVAIFQHFSLPGVLEARIAEKGGSLGSDEVLGDLAQEFGRGAGLHASLRTALTKKTVLDGEEPMDRRIYEVWEPHDRGAILLGAVFDAFIRIYEYRSRDLIRLATGGQDKLPHGPVNHDLAARLAEEAGKSAQHVLNMCIRALDYCPPVDLTFGDYLRALMTADVALVPKDEKGYRIAFLEAFRARGIYPGGVRSMSVDSLLWRPPNDSEDHSIRERLKQLGFIEKIRDFADAFRRFYSRDAMHGYLSHVRDVFKDMLKQLAPEELELLSLDASLPYDVFSLRLSEKQGPYGRIVPQVIVSIVQEKQEPMFESGEGPMITVEGGATIIIDPQHARVDYVIGKSVQSKSRLKRQRSYLQDPRGSLSELYFGDDPNRRFAMLHREAL